MKRGVSNYVWQMKKALHCGLLWFRTSSQEVLLRVDIHEDGKEYTHTSRPEIIELPINLINNRVTY